MANRAFRSLRAPGLLLALAAALATPADAADCGLPNVESAVCASLVGLGPTSTVQDISADGHTVVGQQDGYPARWVDRVPESIGSFPENATGGYAAAVTSDGSLVIGELNQPEPPYTALFQWTPATGLQMLDLSPTSWWPYPTAVSEDGSVIAGSIDGVFAALWRDGTRTMLNSEEMGYGAWISALSADGTVAVGYGNYDMGFQALLWDEDGVTYLMQSWRDLNDSHAEGSANGISPDGAIVVGNAHLPIPRPGPWPLNRPRHPVRWDGLEHEFLGVGAFTGGSAHDVSADGARVVGSVSAAGVAEAASWDADGTLEILADRLGTRGVDLTGWNLYGLRAVSDDGRTMAGWGRFEGAAQGYVAVLSPTVGLDVVPGSSSNFIAVGPYRGVKIVLYGSESLDVGTLDLALLRFGPGGAPVFRAFEPVDLNGDGHLDRRLVFKVAESGLAIGDTTACLSADGAEPFRVCSAVQVTTGACGLGFEVALVLVPLMFWRRGRARAE